MITLLMRQINSYYPELMGIISMSGFLRILGKFKFGPANRFPLALFCPNNFTVFPLIVSSTTSTTLSI